MKVNIWSDVRCPFCYIGKKKFEQALDKFEHKDQVEVEWKSFQLDPQLKTQASTDIYDYFSEMKGMPREQVKGMFDHVTEVAKEVGLDFNLGGSVLANSFNAHRLIQYAKYKGLGNEIEEELFRLHFIEGRNIDDMQVLLEAGKSIGLEEPELNEVLSTDAFSDEVKLDELAAQQIGVRGVPFFVFDEKYGVSGAQSPDLFLQTLEKAWAEAG
jgi:predicted DsbA family dithiol-disulfide isomerase